MLYDIRKIHTSGPHVEKISKPVLPTRPIYRQTAVFQTLGADRDFEEIGCRFFADRNFGKNSRILADFWQIWPILGRFLAIFGCKN